MPKTPKAPPGFYTASQAIKRLGMPKSTFYDLVEKETIKKFIQPGRSDAYYLKAAIDDLAKARQLFTIQYATDVTEFTKAKEEDVQGIYDLATSLWGTRGTYPYEQRLARYRRNPDIFYVLKYLDIVVGYITLMPVTERSIKEIMETGKRASAAITLDDILPLTPNHNIEYAFVEIAVRDGVPKPKQYAMRLIMGISQVINSLAGDGIIIKNLFGTSRTPDGIGISRKFGFKEFPIPSSEGTLAFILDLTSSNHPFAEEYRKIIEGTGTTSKEPNPKP